MILIYHRTLNKILKDIIVKYKNMRGFDSPYIPGWDCHGMPIEHQLLKTIKNKQEKLDLLEVLMRQLQHMLII